MNDFERVYGFRRCDHCGKECYPGDIHETANEVCLCVDCYENHTVQCDDCWCMFYGTVDELCEDGVMYETDDGCVLCALCYEEYENEGDEE